MNTVFDVPLKEIRSDDEFNCRGAITPFDVIDLIKDIEKVSESTPQHPSGLLQPITLTPIDPPVKLDDDREVKYDIIAGFRRYKAFICLKRETIPATVIPGLDERQKLLLNFKENYVRKDLNILQEAKTLQRFVDLDFTEHMIMEELHVTRGWVQSRLMLLKLPEPIQKEAASGILTQTHIRDLYTLKDPTKQFEAVKAIKTAKERSEGSKAVSIKTMIKKDRKSYRDRAELFKMQDYIYEAIGNNLATRTIAWAGGEISDTEFHQSMKEFADSVGKEYTIPTFDS
jgi:ParB family chromosome partitioning protein